MININLIKLTTDIILELDNMSRITLPKNALEKIKIGQAFPHCQNSCHPHPNNPNGGKGDNHGTIQCRTQTSNIKQTFIT